MRLFRNNTLFRFLFLTIILTGQSLMAAEGSNGNEAKALIWAQQGLQWNQHYMQVISPAISNYGTDEQKLTLQVIVNHDMYAQILFLATRFNDAYAQVRITQKLLIGLYQELVIQDSIATHKRLVDYSARIMYELPHKVILKKYLYLALRDLEVARLKNLRQYNERPWLYLIRLNTLSEALKLVRHANRFYILMALHIDSIYPPNPNRQITYKEGRRLILSGFHKDRLKFLLMHDDNFFKVGLNKPDLFKQYRAYPKLRLVDKDLPGRLKKDPPRYR